MAYIKNNGQLHKTACEPEKPYAPPYLDPEKTLTMLVRGVMKRTCSVIEKPLYKINTSDHFKDPESLQWGDLRVQDKNAVELIATADLQEPQLLRELKLLEKKPMKSGKYEESVYARKRSVMTGAEGILRQAAAAERQGGIANIIERLFVCGEREDLPHVFHYFRSTEVMREQQNFQIYFNGCHLDGHGMNGKIALLPSWKCNGHTEYAALAESRDISEE